MVEIDSYYVTPVPHERSMTANWTGLGARSFGQTFRPSATYLLTSCKFSVRRSSGSLTGNLKAYLYEHTGTFGAGTPTGDPLATSTSVDMSILTATHTLYTFTFDGTYTLVANTAYCLVLYSTDGDMSGSVYPKIGSVAVGVHEGNGVRFLSAIGSWEAYSTIDVMFYVYGDEALDLDTEMKQFPDNVAMSVTAADIETWLDNLSITTVHKLNIQHKGGFYRAVVVYV